MRTGIIPFVLAVLLLSGCSNEKRKADLNGIDFDVKIGRFDQDFWALKGSDYHTTLPDLAQRYPDLLPIYLEHVVEFGGVNDSLTYVTLPLFFGDSGVAKLYTDALNAYSDVSDIEKKVTEAFRRAKYFFPKSPTPKLYMHVSGLNQSLVVGDGFISLSTDNYLGADYPTYKDVVYNYLIPNMKREKVASDYVVGWLSSEFPFSPLNGQLLEEMLYRGKIIYLTSVLMPRESDDILMGYSKEQLDFCRQYEHDMWMTLIESKHLFSQEGMYRAKYLNDAPFTQPFTQESPGRAGVYIGWQIVESYMKNHPDVTPLDLILDLNAQGILEQSGYNPK